MRWVGDAWFWITEHATVLSAAISAIATIFIARYTLTLRRSTDKLAATGDAQVRIARDQVDISSRQQSLAHLQFMAEHRPRLRVRNIVIADDRTGRFHPGVDLTGWCYVDNVGGTPAAILGSHLQFFADPRGLPMVSPYELETGNNFISGDMNVGEHRPCPFERMSPLATEGEVNRMLGGSHNFYILGWIDYRDRSQRGVVDGVTFRVAFCRQWDHRRDRFVSIGSDPDYEYET